MGTEDIESQENENDAAEDEERGTTVDLEEGGDDQADDEGEEPAAAAGQQADGKPKTRKEKKAERGRLRQAHEATTRENGELRERIARLEGAVSRSARDTSTKVGRAAGEDDPSESELNEIYDQQITIQTQIEALGKNITKEQVDRFQKQAIKLDIRKSELIAERVNKRNARSSGDSERDLNKRALQIQYADVYTHPRAPGWAQGRFHQLFAEEGKEDGSNGIELVRRSLEEARVKFGLAKRPAPTDNERSRYSGVARGGGSAAAGPPTKITLSKGQMKMADAAYGHIKDKDVRYKTWAQKAGRRIAAAQQKGRRAE